MFSYLGLLITEDGECMKEFRTRRELLGERDNARNNAICMQARKTTQGLDGQHQ